MKRIVSILILLVTVSVFNSCSVTLSGASIPPQMKTVYVQYIDNNALFVKNGLSQSITEALKSRIRSQTRLSIVNTPEADGTFSGAITSYTIAPVSIQATGNSNAPPIANASRLTVTVKIKFTINFPDASIADKKLAFEQDFTKTADFTGDIAAQEDALVANINRQLTEDIFNKAFANW